MRRFLTRALLAYVVAVLAFACSSGAPLPPVEVPDQGLDMGALAVAGCPCGSCEIRG